MMTETTPDLRALSREWAVLHVQRGQIREHTYRGRAWQTAIYKHPAEGPVEINRYGLVGDEQTGAAPDLDRAVSFHSATHYSFWRGYFRREIPIGFFGENLTVAGLADEDICVGDVVRVGTALLQITQPRTPCYKQARKMGEPKFVKLLLQTGRLGFLARVLEPGELETGSRIELLERPCPQANLIFVNRKLYDTDDRESARELAELVPLAHDWRAKFAEIAARA
ncbi:MAG TPA: MOSC domain-containing protein [Roseiflexaceae bacterium]|nr:MOSC domain-containing protein [Roseiflexaceae bacterium]